MKEELNKLALYFDTLEAQIASLENRLDHLEESFASIRKNTETKQNPSVSISDDIRQLRELLEKHTQKVDNLGMAIAEVNARIDDEDMDEEEAFDSDLDDEEEEEVEADMPEERVSPIPEVVAEESHSAPQATKQSNEKSAPKTTSTLTGKPVTDLRHAVSLGDRFLFQRELFSQNGELMQTTLEALNKQTDFDASIVYLDMHFPQWEKESEAYNLLVNILHRRFQ